MRKMHLLILFTLSYLEGMVVDMGEFAVVSRLSASPIFAPLNFRDTVNEELEDTLN